MSTFTIGELSKAIGLRPPTIRYYEEIGLIPSPKRSEAGYRLYSQQDAQRLKLIQRAKMLALSLEEIKEVVGFAIDGRCGSLQSELLALLDKKLAETQHKISELALLQEELSRFRDELSKRIPSSREHAASSTEPCVCLGDEQERVCR